MPYVTPQQIKKKRPAIAERSSVNLPAWILLFVRANHRCCFIEYAVDELMAVFCAERFRQFDRFVNGHFVWHIATFRQLVQRNAQYCFFYLAQFFQQTGQVRLHQSVEVCGVSRHPGQQLTEVQDVNVFYILFSQELVFNISDVVLGQLPGVERLDGTLTSAATSSRFHGFPLTNFRP
ncbi:Hypothetical protein c0526 [Escherichia coli CFT073]|uniref:Uncharacterized protein n=1 Tax=Escherichia coli O6:H1 (strain CFT073 / ATCC 700928 / UPEC) TaxID=199310 RepID=A0A0H2V6V2_ECOL6|nr:Hypothetical protein c0526 [Escherichia coli CFT073]